jgi:Tfp pilus assembly protein PilO
MAGVWTMAASVWADVGECTRSAKSLDQTITRFEDRTFSLDQLQKELRRLVENLASLAQVIPTETAMPQLLQAPINQCNSVCRKLEESLKEFEGQERTGLLDWDKMKFLGSGITEFIDTIALYNLAILDGKDAVTV